MNRRQFIGTLAVSPFVNISKVLASTQPIQLPESNVAAFNVPENWEVTHDRFLYAIGERESGHNPLLIGTHGERSEYQMMEDTWRCYRSAPFIWATTKPEEAHRTARRHLDHMVQETWCGLHWYYDGKGSPLIRFEDGAYKAALAWHYGLEGAKRHGSNDEYALAVERLFLS